MARKKKEPEVRQYSVMMRCTVNKDLTVEAASEEEARAKAGDWDVLDEREVDQVDWEITSVRADE